MKLNSNRSYIPVKKASNILEHFIIHNRKLFYEAIYVRDSYKRVLAENIISTKDIPAVDSSHMDGYAVKAGDIIHASKQRPAVLNLRKDQIKPNRKTSLRYALQKQEAFRIVTGGYIPKGANTRL
jgi:molybdopterin molybdotransferase